MILRIDLLFQLTKFIQNSSLTLLSPYHIHLILGMHIHYIYFHYYVQS